MDNSEKVIEIRNVVNKLSKNINMIYELTNQFLISEDDALRIISDAMDRTNGIIYNNIHGDTGL